MVKSNNRALGLIFPNFYDPLVPEMVSERLMASIPFASRYRMIDFVLSSMVNSGIDNVSILAKENYHSLMDHIGSGREWDLSRKNGGLTIWPPFAQKAMTVYTGRIEALANILIFLKSQKEKYVILSDTNIAINFDFRKLIRAHIESGADFTVAYNDAELPEISRDAKGTGKGFFYSFDLAEDGRITKLYINSQEEGVQHFGLNIYCVERELLISLVEEAASMGKVYLERDILAQRVDDLKIYGYEYDGYVARVTGLKSYFDENMKLLENGNLDALFEGGSIYTKLRDDNPTRYISGAAVKNTMVADGCKIEGEVENCVLFRGVTIGKGAKVKNCVLMQDTVVEPGVNAEYIITDKSAVLTEGQEIKGTDSFPIYISKHKVV